VVWYNDNPSAETGLSITGDGNGQYGLTDPDEQYKFNTFGMTGVRKASTDATKLPNTNNGDGLFYNKITNPVIKINYRGATTTVPVDIWTKVDTLYPEYKESAKVLADGQIEVNAKLIDNDVAGQDAAWYATQVNVYAVMSSARNNVGTKDNAGYVLLSWGAGNVQATEEAGYTKPAGDDAATATVKLRRQYGMNFGLQASWNKGSTPPGWNTNGVIFDKDGIPSDSPAWGQTDNAKNNNAGIKTITFYYSTPWSLENNMSSGKILKTTLPVQWINIRTRG